MLAPGWSVTVSESIEEVTFNSVLFLCAKIYIFPEPSDYICQSVILDNVSDTMRWKMGLTEARRCRADFNLFLQNFELVLIVHRLKYCYIEGKNIRHRQSKNWMQFEQPRTKKGVSA